MNKTKDNLKAAFIGESEARNKYTFYADAARKEGFHYIARIFEETAENEKFHALEEVKLLLGETSTLDNLKEAIGDENYESESMYPQFAREAELEGNQAAAILFTQIAKIEKHHRDRFRKLLELVEMQMVYKRDEPIKCQQYKICNTGKCPMGIATQDKMLRANLNVDKAARRLENFLTVATAELTDFARLTGNDSIHGMSVADLCTVNSEISRFTAVEHV
jgi:rubrerythrin